MSCTKASVEVIESWQGECDHLLFLRNSDSVGWGLDFAGEGDPSLPRNADAAAPNGESVHAW
jgi:hypothetical protein